MKSKNINNMTIEELVGGASTQDIAAYFRNIGKSGTQPTYLMGNNETPDSGSESARPSQQNTLSHRDMRQPSGFTEQAKAYIAQLTVTDWILIVIALLIFINILVTVKYHD
ncbi:MAG: hypothetical protein ACI3Z8_04705 [Paludibacteraceae bacterium]